jgi:hypothetical protein|tara:strand:- start:173 stop:868 length:696 start_codon:yes stop_codon:yes gene_type:complete
MKKFKYLVVNGCSYSAGGCMYVAGDAHDDKEQVAKSRLNRFSKKLSEKLNCEEINLSASGGSNQRIFRTTFDWIQKNKEKVKDTLFVIGLSGPARVDLYSKHENRYICGQPFYSGPSVKLIAEKMGCSVDEVWGWVNFKINYTYEEKEVIKEIKRECIILNKYVDGNAIFFNALRNINIFIDEVDYMSFGEHNTWQDFVGIEVGHPKENHHHEMADRLYKHIQKSYEENNT